jgi:hypothetical protein
VVKTGAFHASNAGSIPAGAIIAVVILGLAVSTSRRSWTEGRDGKRTVTDRVVDGKHDRLAVGADAEPIGALPVLDRDGRRHPKFGADIAAAVRTLVDEVHGRSFLSSRRSLRRD